MFHEDSQIRQDIKRLGRQMKKAPLLFARLGECHFRLGDCERAEPILRRGVDEHPDYLTGWLILGEVYLYRGLYRDAEECAQRGLQLDPRHLGLMQLLLKIRRMQENEAEVRQIQGEIAALDPLREVEDADGGEPEYPPPTAEAAPAASIWKTRTAERSRPVESAEPETAPPEASDPAPLPLVEALTEAGSLTLKDYLGDIAAPGANTVRLQTDLPGDSDGEPPAFQGRIVTRTMGDLYAKQGRFDEAIAIFEQLAAADPDHSDYPARLNELRRQQAAYLHQQKDSEHG